MPRHADDAIRHETLISAAAVTASLVLSVVHIHFDPLVNPDGLTYLLAAQAWLDAGYAGAASVYPLPIYSIVIGAIHSATGASLLTSAQCLDAVLIAGIVVALQQLVRELGGHARAQIVVVVLGLLLPELNGYRSFILRDFGYWLCWLAALIALLRYARAPASSRAAAFFGWSVGAALFRVEALALLAVMPLALVSRRPGGTARVSLVYAPVVAAAFVAFAVATAWPRSAAGQWVVAIIERLDEIVRLIPSAAKTRAAGFGLHVLDPRFHDYALFGALGGLLAMIFAHVVNAATLPLAAIAAMGLRKGVWDRFERDAKAILLMATIVSLTALAFVLVARGIIQTRYALPVGLLAVVVAAFSIDEWQARAKARADRRVAYVALALVAAYLVGEAGYGLVTSKQHYLRAAAWLEDNTPVDARVLSNDARVVYLADRRVDWRTYSEYATLHASALPDTFDYVAIAASRRSPAAEGEFGARTDLRTVARFDNGHGDVFVIYRHVPTTELGGGATSEAAPASRPE